MTDLMANFTPRKHAYHEKEKCIGVAEKLSKIAVPQFIIGGGSSVDGRNVNDSLMNMLMLRQLGILPEKQS